MQLRWPWVSRATSDAFERAFDETLAQFHRQSDLLDRERERYDALLEKYHEAMMAKTAPPALPTQPNTSEPGIPAVILQAIAEATMGQPRDVANAVRSKAMRLHFSEGKKPDEVAAIVRRGESLS